MVRKPEGPGRLVPRPHRPYADVLLAEVHEPLVQRARGERRGELPGESLLVRCVLLLGELGSLEEPAEALEEVGLQRADGHVSPVGRLVQAIARQAARQEPGYRLASNPIRDQVVGAMGHRHDEASSAAGSSAPEQGCEDLSDRGERPGGEIGDLDGRERRRGVLEDSGPSEVVQVVADAGSVLVVVPEAGDGAVHDGLGNRVGPYSEALRNARPEPLEHHVRPSAERSREPRLGLEVAHDGFGSLPERGIPRSGCRPHRVSRRRFEAHDPRAQAGELSARVRAGKVARQIDDEHARERLHGRGGYLYPRLALTDRSIAQLEKRKLILDSAIRVFADRGYHRSRVGDIAEHAGVAHGLLYHYFASKDDVLRTIFVENWGELMARFRAVAAADEPADEKLQGIAKILLRTWRNDAALVTVMVRDVARSKEIQGRVDEVGEAFAIIERIIREGQRSGTFRRDLDARLASWVFYGGLEEVLTGWVLGRLPDGEDSVVRAEQTAIELALRGLCA